MYALRLESTLWSEINFCSMSGTCRDIQHRGESFGRELSIWESALPNNQTLTPSMAPHMGAPESQYNPSICPTHFEKRTHLQKLPELGSRLRISACLIV